MAAQAKLAEGAIIRTSSSKNEHGLFLEPADRILRRMMNARGSSEEKQAGKRRESFGCTLYVWRSSARREGVEMDLVGTMEGRRGHIGVASARRINVDRDKKRRGRTDPPRRGERWSYCRKRVAIVRRDPCISRSEQF